MQRLLKSVVPIVVDHARGAVVTDVNGRKYVDCFAGISVVSAEPCNPQVIAAAKAQMDKLVHCGSYIYHAQRANFCQRHDLLDLRERNKRC